MAQVYTHMTVPLTKHTVIQRIEMPQGDSGRGLDILITDDLAISDTENEQTTLRATLWGKKPSGKEVSFDANNVISYYGTDSFRCVFDGSDTFANLISESGAVECVVTLVDGETAISTFSFFIDVERNVANESNVLSSDEYKNVEDALVRLQAKEDELDALIPQLTEQSKLTVNVRYGPGAPAVEPGDKTGDIYIQTK